jgi:hypothetical protein
MTSDGTTSTFGYVLAIWAATRETSTATRNTNDSNKKQQLVSTRAGKDEGSKEGSNENEGD